MARQLSRAAKEELLENSSLYVEICDTINVKPASLPPLVYRNSPWLTNYDVVIKTAAAMKKTPDEILEEVKEPQPAVEA